MSPGNLRLPVAVFATGSAFLALSIGLGRHPQSKTMSNAAEIMQRSCASCHTPGANVPLYGRVPPISWLVQHDIKGAQERLVLLPNQHLSSNQRAEIVDAIHSGSMPPVLYSLAHPESHLSVEDLRTLDSWSNH